MKANTGQVARRRYLKLALLTIPFIILIMQPRFSTVYPQIDRTDILNLLVEAVDWQPAKPGLSLCNYDDIISDMNTIDIPKGGFSPLIIDDEDLHSGEFIPTECIPRYRVAVIVPFRNRSSQLQVFIPYMHNFLRKQRLNYRIFVVEQGDTGPWNKGKLFNAASKIAKDYKYPCLILHDVDMLPLSPAHLYACTKQPRHMSASVDKFRYNLPYVSLIGGALAILQEQYERINGFSNRFERWGGEDDDLFNRLTQENYTIYRFPPDMSRYTMIVHNPEPINPDRLKILQENQRKPHHSDDGISTLKYKRLTVTNHPLYVNITVQL